VVPYVPKVPGSEVLQKHLKPLERIEPLELE
jgi:hypothetical protein